MKKTLLIITALLFPFVVSCKRMDPEIVEFDASYTPNKPKGIDRSKIEKPKVDLLTQVLFFVDNNKEVNLDIEQEGEELTVTPLDNITMEMRLAHPASSQFTASIATMTAADYPETYKSVITAGKVELPAEMYTLSQKEVTFAANDRQKSVTLSFDTDKMKGLKDGQTYCIPLVAKVSDTNIKVHNFFLVAVTPVVVGEDS